MAKIGRTLLLSSDTFLATQLQSNIQFFTSSRPPAVDFVSSNRGVVSQYPFSEAEPLFLNLGPQDIANFGAIRSVHSRDVENAVKDELNCNAAGHTNIESHG